MAYVPPRRINSVDLEAICRSIGMTPEKILDTVKRVENKRCETCGSLSCAHIQIEVSE